MPTKAADKLLAVLREEFKELFELPVKLKPGEGVKMFVMAVEKARQLKSQNPENEKPRAAGNGVTSSSNHEG